MKNILVTGAAGFVGSNFLSSIAASKPEFFFLCLDKFTYAANRQAVLINSKLPNVRFKAGDICDKSIVEEIIAEYEIDGVINFAAESHVDRSIDSPSVFTRSNFEGVQVLLDACRKAKVTRFLQISTDEVYGDSTDLKIVFTETSSLHPSSPYSACKAGADLLTKAYERTYGLNVGIVRMCNNFGPWQHAEKFIPTVIRCLLANNPIPVYGTGKNRRDWIYAPDASQRIWEIFLNGDKGEIYNITSGISLSNLDLIGEIADILKVAPSIVFVADRPGHDKSYDMDGSKTDRIYPKPYSDFKSSLETTVKSYLPNT